MNKQLRQHIRKLYKKFTPIILKEHYIDPYFFDWTITFTLIEQNVWTDIRRLGLPFYPQYPVKQYFIDFADPYNKIGIEVDGKKYHSKPEDIEKDKKRQKEIEKEGWRILRIGGWQTFKQFDDYCDDEKDEQDEEEHEKAIEDYYKSCSEGILWKLRKNYY